MAAPLENMVRASGDSDSCSSDDEVLQRCREAVWETGPVKGKEDDKVNQSKRVVVSLHEHDGNELQVSQGFRTHVAKKLGHLLDSCISETQAESSSRVESSKHDDDDNDDEGFRLFSTSVPGQKAVEPPPPPRRRPVQTSSDSDSEMETRLREAAVSVEDLMPSMTQPAKNSTPDEEPEKIKKKKKKKKVIKEEEEGQVVKKKKKRRQEEEEGAQVDCTSSLEAHSDNELENSEQKTDTQVKVKQRKKKKKKGDGMGEAVNGISRE